MKNEEGLTKYRKKMRKTKDVIFIFLTDFQNLNSVLFTFFAPFLSFLRVSPVMFSSQTSSASSASSQRAEFVYPEGLPEKFRKQCIYSRQVDFFDDSSVTILVTTLFELIECKNSDVSNYLNLSCHCQDIQSVTTEDIDFDPVFLDCESVLYVLRIKSILFGCSRSRSQLKLLKVLISVSAFMPNIDDDGEIFVEVTFINGEKQKTTFDDGKVEKFISSRHSEKFSGIFQAAKQKTNCVKAKLADVTSEIAVLDSKIHEDSKCLPKLMLEDDPNERSPLVKYGSIWTRVVNDKLVIGIPVFCASKR